uniref:Arf-GAP domain-containing protein n=1 Tax=Salix viminalis TaxID=40686 RepID=A0A6N2L0W1_SALVM
MTKKNKEERIEKIIRGLLILPENRRCINCNSCREFTRGIKSISMAKFNAEEVSALQEVSGGNFLVINQQKVRDFIKHVYVDRRYTGEKSQEKLPLLKLTDKEESGENRWVLYSGGSKSPNYEDRHGWSEGSGFSGRADDKTIKFIIMKEEVLVIIPKKIQDVEVL